MICLIRNRILLTIDLCQRFFRSTVYFEFKYIDSLLHLYHNISPANSALYFCIPVRRNSRTGIKLCRRFPFGRNAFLRRLCIQWGGRFADHVCRLTVRSYRIPAGISGLLPTQFIKCRHSGMESNSHQYCGCHQRKIILQLI